MKDLTERNRTILDLLATGKSLSETARALGLSKGTVSGVSYRASGYKRPSAPTRGLCRGERHRSAKLTDAAVTDMRANKRYGWTYEELAEFYDVNVSTIAHALLRRTWKHLP